MTPDPLAKKIDLGESVSQDIQEKEALDENWTSRAKKIKIPLSMLKKKKNQAPVGVQKKTHSPKKKKIVLGLVIVLLLLLIGGGLLALLTVPALIKLKDNGQKLMVEAQAVMPALQAQDLKLAAAKIETTNQAVEQLAEDYGRLKWMSFIPFLGSYYRDGEHLVGGGRHLLEAAELTVEALQPYSDILGLEGEEKKPAETMTAEERILLALDTLDKVQPNLNEISAKLNLARQEIDQIDPDRYPEEVAGRQVRRRVVELVKTIDSTAELAAQIKPVMGFLKPLMGVGEEKTYLLLFQNDAELRPTGGFMTAYALITVFNGKLSAGASYDIYTLDARFGNRLKAPDPIRDYLPNVNYWHIRDMNLSPDFAKSMAQFWEHAGSVVRVDDIDGIIAVDTSVLVDIMEVLGPIGVAGWGNFSAENDPRCDCPQVFYELELYADKPVGTFKEERKGIIGPLMHSILLNAMGSPRKKWPLFFNVAWENLQEKHILMYFFDEEIQRAAETLNAAGRIKEFDGDYLHVNDTNFGGAKSNMFIEQTVTQLIEVEDDGSVIKTVKIDYRNPAPPSDCNLERGELCLNGLYRDWFRLYVPQGSQLIEATGSEVGVKTYDELGKTVFEVFYGDKSPLRPEGTARLEFKYRLPFKTGDGQDYRLLIQKQPGTKNHEQVVIFNGTEQVFELDGDTELQLN